MKFHIQRLQNWWQQMTSRFSKSVEIAIVAGVMTAVYVVTFSFLRPILGNVVSSFIMVPVLLLAWIYGFWIGVWAAVAAYFVNVLVFVAMVRPFPTIFFLEALPGHVITLLAAMIVGKFKDLSIRLKKELVERQQIEKTLQESEQLYRLLSENLNDLICLHEPDGKMTYVSSSSIDILGYAYDELRGKSPLPLFRPQDRQIFRSPEYLHTLDQNEDFSFEAQMQHKDGHYLWVEVRVRPFTSAPQTLWQSITRDISERKAREAALKQAKDEAETATLVKSEFLANMSHEIRTPMNAIVGLTGLLLDTELTSEQQDFLQTVRVSSDSLLGIINNILDFSKIEAGKLELEQAPFILRECMEESLDLNVTAADQKGLEMACFIGENVPEIVNGDVTRLRQVLVNLLSNAVKFTAKGEVVLSVTLVGTQNGMTTLRFAVLDTGIGIPKGRMDRLFQSFSQVDSSTTRQFGGTGLGLVISQRLVEAMGGQMWVESEPGRGSTFNFTIVASTESMFDEDETAVPSTLLRGKRILVVDDNDVNRLILKHYLYHWQADSYLVASGEEALRLLAHDKQFDLAILDMQMPQMDGVMLAQAIRKNCAQRPFPLILLTSLGQPVSPKDQALFALQISKPVKQKNLFYALEQVLSQNIIVRNGQEPVSASLELEQSIPHLRILLAEDNAINQKVALRMLERLGYFAGVAGTGQEVIDALEQQTFDIILMDVQMPEMDGLSATQLIRQNPAIQQPYIIALTANALKGDRERFLAAGMNDYLSKPVRLEDLSAAINRYSLPLSISSDATTSQ